MVNVPWTVDRRPWTITSLNYLCWLLMTKVHYTQCPVCGSNAIHPLLTVKDYTVSGEPFVIWQCADCTLRFTQDVPDEEAIGAYYKSPDYISHTNTSKGLINKLYQRVRQLTLQQKANLIATNTKSTGRNLLDVGCGVGAFMHTMQQAGWSVTGIEPDADTRQLAKQTYGLDLLEPAALFSLPDHSFDVITLWHVLEHVHSLHSYVERLKELLAPGGKIFIAVPNYQSVDAGIYGLAWAAYDVPRHLYHFTPMAMQALMEQHGLTILAKKAMPFDSFYISLLSSKYRNGRTNWLGAFVNGLRSNMAAAANIDKCSSVIYIVSKE